MNRKKIYNPPARKETKPMNNRRPEKHYSLTNEIIDTVSKLKKAAVEEARQFDSYQHRKFNVPENRCTPPKIMAEMFKDYLFGDYDFPARDMLDAYLDTLTDENLLDLVMVYYMGTTDDATLTIDPGEPRFLDYYYDSPHLWGECRDGLMSTIHGKIYFSDGLQKGRELLNKPKNPDWKPPRPLIQFSEETMVYIQKRREQFSDPA